ncbi:hypothetical protein PBI_SCTP2_281 [Salicola phage SCTP-2]|nr:hypothetical protein PBI_SCTP2_281 [Salicola phage SCTP-2]
MASDPFDYQSLIELYRKSDMDKLSKKSYKYLNQIILGSRNSMGVLASQFDEHLRWDNPSENNPDYDYYTSLKKILDEKFNNSKDFFEELFKKWNRINQNYKTKHFKNNNKKRIDNVIESLKDPSKFNKELFYDSDNTMKRESGYNIESQELKKTIKVMLQKGIRLKEMANIFPEVEFKQQTHGARKELADLLTSYIWVNDKFRNNVLIDLYSKFSK